MKRTIKKSISVFLTFTLFFGSFAFGFSDMNWSEFAVKVEATETYAEGYYTYTVDENENATITDADKSISGAVTIPSTLGGYYVTGIGAAAFSSCEKLEEVTIPDIVIELGNYAFSYCKNLKEAKIGKGLTVINDGAFMSCSNLTTVNIPDNITKIGKEAFFDCALLKLEIGDGVKNIGYNAFKTCSVLEEVILGENVEILDEGVFYLCEALSKVIIDKNLKKIGRGAFHFCEIKDVYYAGTEEEWNNISVSEYNSKLLNANINFNYGHNHSYTSSITVLATCTENGVLTYTCGCGYSYTESIPASNHNAGEWITEIKATNSAPGKKVKKCVRCNNELESKIIPAKDMKASGFCGENGDNLMWTLDNNGLLKIFGNGKMADYADKDGAPWSSYPSSIKSVEIAENVTYIGSYAFPTYYSYLSKVKISDSVTEIGQGAFEGLDWLTSLELGNSIEIINNNAFQCCEKLNALSLPESVTRIGDGAFWSCRALESVFIPQNVNYIGCTSFADCINLDGVAIDENNKNYKTDSFGNVLSKDGTVLFQYISNNEKYDVPSDVRIIADYAFHFANIKRVNIHSEVTEIGQYAFSATDLEYLHIPQKTIKIGKGIFFLTSAYICSDDEDCYAKTYAEENGIEFRVCNGHEAEAPEETTTQSTTQFVTQPTTTYLTIPVEVSTTTKPAEAETSTTKPAEIPITTKPVVTEPSTEHTTKPVETTKPSTTKPVSTTKPEPIEEEIIKKPSTSTVKYGETLILHADFANIPEGATIEWSVEGEGVTIVPSDDGKTCAVTSTSTGDVTITAKYTDANGVEHVSEQEIESNASFWQKIVSFFKNLFGINRIIEQVFKF